MDILWNYMVNKKEHLKAINNVVKMAYSQRKKLSEKLLFLLLGS